MLRTVLATHLLGCIVWIGLCVSDCVSRTIIFTNIFLLFIVLYIATSFYNACFDDWCSGAFLPLPSDDPPGRSAIVAVTQSWCCVDLRVAFALPVTMRGLFFFCVSGCIVLGYLVVALACWVLRAALAMLFWLG